MTHEGDPTRRLPALLLDLLDEPERSRIARLVDERPDAQETLDELRRLTAEWADEEVEHVPAAELQQWIDGNGSPARRRVVSEHVLGCPDCRMEAELRIAAPEPGRSPKPRAWPRLVAAAAMLGLAVAGGAWIGSRGSPGRAAGPVLSTLDLGVTRGEQAAVVRLSDLREDGLALRVETRLPGKEASWDLVADATRPILHGLVRFEPSSSVLRRIDVFVPTSALEPARYELILRGDEGTERRWAFAVRD